MIILNNMKINFPENILLASNNIGKIREFRQLFESININIVPQSEFNIKSIDESFETFIENALAKANNATILTKLPSIADDSGLCVVSLNGEPGIRSARYAPKKSRITGNIDEENNKFLLKNLRYISDRRAYYVCVIVMMRYPKDPNPIIAQGRLNGLIIDSPEGKNGFGYDPYFLIPESKQTLGSMTLEQKNRISHRYVALKKLINCLMEEYG